ncbi:Ubiquitin carboxyl-terminal hydrolase 12 [Zea mays]|uniref:ubiquitinyl hydrolase 1 n=1 Tax=Zea mays TaxID=4577 RepID=A0A3L6F3N2_MAIZE|nr:Ubiquitin carboxyl-terminal hydrolase 12 [Zea mays]
MVTPPTVEQEDEEMLVPRQEAVDTDAAQPMEVVAQTEVVSTAESQPVEDPQTSRFTWTIENFTRFSEKKHYLEVFVVGGFKWSVLIFPKGNNVDHFSMYLDVADSTSLPYGWSRYAQFSLAVVNQIQPEFTIRKETQHQFNARESDWGFTSFMPLSELYDASRGYLVNDTVVVEAEVAVRRMVDYWTYDSKKETGYVGLKNQGATCYMNSLLQTLYHIPYFRKSLFYKLQYSDSSVATKELTKSFGWDTYDSFMQHDVQELNRVLSEKLEDKMKDAKKGVLFLDFPPVLQLQLKRFEYDYMRDSMVKINDRYEFPLQLDLDRDGGKYIAPNADRMFLFIVVGYMVVTTMHSYGQLYLSNVPRPGPHRKLGVERFIGEYKFDDERVTKEDAKKALEEQYGGDEELPQINPGFNNAPFKFTKYSNAYMLVYIRESAKEKIMCTVDEKDIAEHLRVRLKKEQEEKEHKKKEKAEAHLYTIIKVARDEDLKEQIGKGIYFDLVDHEKVHNFRIQKQMPFSCFKEEVAKEYGIPVQFQRFWLWAKRQNHTYRPNRPLTVHEETQSVGQLREISNKAHNVELKLFLEVELGLDLRPLPPPEKGKEDILLFFKFYNPEKEELWSKLHTYDDVVERVARQLELDDPAKIRLTPHNCYSQQPKPQPVKYRGVVYLSDMLIHYNQTSDILYYEVLDIPLPELQFLKTLKVAFHHPTKDEVVIHSIRLPKNSTIADVINDLKTKVELSSPNAELRVLEVFYHKIYKIPEEEKNIGPNDRLIHVYHFKKDINQTQQIQNFGDPFVLVVHEGETLAEVKKRIQSKLQVSADEFSKWKFAFISMNRPDYLQDSDVVPTGFQRREVYGAWEQYLGIEHADTAPKRVYTVNQAFAVFG